MVKTSTPEEFEVVERLAGKIKLLIQLLHRTRADQIKTAEDNARLSRELDALKTKLSESADANSEMTTLRAEREQIRTRVSEMLEQLETLSL